MPIRYDRVKHCYYNDVTNEDIPRDELPEPYWHNPDGTTNDIP